MADSLAWAEHLLIRIDERTNFLATKQDVEAVRSELGKELTSKATSGTVWAMVFTVSGLFLTAAAFGALYMPYLATLLRRPH